MSNLNLNGIDVDREDINDIYIDSRRNITVTLRDNKKIVVKRSEESKKIYKRLTEEDG